jgi:hypothetical protein
MNLPPEEHFPAKPLAGTCHHRWQRVDAPYERAELCDLCKLYRYKVGPRADWEYRAPIPRVPLAGE